MNREQCGTPRGATLHRKHGEDVCRFCRVGEAEYQRIRRDNQRRNPRQPDDEPHIGPHARDTDTWPPRA